MATLRGHLTKDAEVRTIEGGKVVVKFTLVENKSFKTKMGEKREIKSIFSCSLWNRSKVAPFLKKGTLIEVKGMLVTYDYTDKDGNHRSGMDMTVDTFEFIAPPRKKENPQSGSVTATDPTDDLPF